MVFSRFDGVGIKDGMFKVLGCFMVGGFFYFWGRMFTVGV